MTNTRITLINSLTLVLLLVMSGYGDTAPMPSKSNLAKEQRWQEQIVPNLVVGEAIRLQAGTQQFLGLYTEPVTSPAKGAVILMHGAGVHPAWQDVIEPLRMELPEHGWYTLSLQMPILTNEAEDKDYAPLFPEVPARVQAGVDFLKAKGVHNIVLAGHSMGASMAEYYLVVHKDPAVTGFIIVSNSFGVKGDQYLDTIRNFKNIRNANILDLHGSEDLPLVKEAAALRSSIAPKTHGDRYQALEIKGVGHLYRERPDELVTQVSAWLDKFMVQPSNN